MSEKKTKRKGMRKYLRKKKEIVENVPKIEKEITTQVQETQRVLNKINPRRNTPIHISIKLMKIKHKEQIVKVTREKQQITHKEIPICITPDLSFLLQFYLFILLYNIVLVLP